VDVVTFIFATRRARRASAAGKPYTAGESSGHNKVARRRNMSIFSEMASAEHTFVGWFEKEITAIEKNAPTIERSAEATFTWATTGLTIIDTLLTAGSPAAGIVGKAISDLKVASATVYDFGASPTAGGLIKDVVSNLSGLESVAGVKNASSVATVGKIVSTLATLAEAFLAIAPAI